MNVFIVGGGPSTDRARTLQWAIGRESECEVLYLCDRSEDGTPYPSFPYDALPCQGLHIGGRAFHGLGALKAALPAGAPARWILLDTGPLQTIRIRRWARRRAVPVEVWTQRGPRRYGWLWYKIAAVLGRMQHAALPRASSSPDDRTAESC